MRMSSPSRFRVNPTAEVLDSSHSVPKHSNSTECELDPSLGIADHRTTLHKVPTPPISYGKHSTPSADISLHSPTLHHNKDLQSACPNRTIKSDIESRIGNHIATSAPCYSNISCITPDCFSSHSGYGLHGTSESIAPHRNMHILLLARSGIAQAADISDPRLAASSRIKAIECELAQLRSRTKVTLHSAYCAPESADVSDHDADPTIIFRQSA
ncbi:hypothetical protein PILCRDRAFT_13331 [Piloderma croceum F 1598]|uniref:Uncharacterized protein n=1 Tax=Piloderma croceum (strain F 1598) TaxID=765440 RepID=A0A0C3F6Y3_PILCF|nr:hypothetical protein PILCRDRAFT_13331 [Piloderma croceum F 1598]